MFDALTLLAGAPPEVATEASSDLFGPIQQQFKLHWGPFIAQCVNFVIVALLLKKFAFKPIQEMLEKRRSRIAEGESKLQQVEAQIAESEKRTQEMLDEANERAKRLVDEAKESAALLNEKKTQEAVASAQAIIAKAEEAAKAERETMAAELKREFGRLVASTSGAVTGGILSGDQQRQISEQALAKIES